MSKKKDNFLKEFFKERKTIGAVSPSSKSLTKKMLENVDFKSSNVIVEFGPGTGVMTREIVARMNPETKLYVFELHVPFFESLQKEFENVKNVRIIKDSAVNIRKYLEEDNNDNTDVIISSLPLTNFDQNLTIRILKSAEKALKHNGLYIQFQYSLNARRLLNKIFDSTAIQFTAMNLPPAFIYTCIKK